MSDGSNDRYPVVVMAGGWCYVRELVMPHYAAKFADRGIASLVFDYRNFGTSTGEPRQHIDPWAQIRDYQNAVSFASRSPQVDGDRIGAWGISYSGGMCSSRRRPTLASARSSR